MPFIENGTPFIYFHWKWYPSVWYILKGPCYNTVEPLLSGYPRGTGKWPLNRGWLLNRGSSEISIMRGINVALFEYNSVGGLLKVIQPVYADVQI